MYYGTLYIKIENDNKIKLYTYTSKDEKERDPKTVQLTKKDTEITFSDPECLRETLIDLYYGLRKDRACVPNNFENFKEEVSSGKYMIRKGTFDILAGPMGIILKGQRDKCSIIITPLFSDVSQEICFSDTGKKPMTTYLEGVLKDVFGLNKSEIIKACNERSKMNAE